MPMRSSPPSPGGSPDMLRHMLWRMRQEPFDAAGAIGLVMILTLAFFA